MVENLESIGSGFSRTYKDNKLADTLHKDGGDEERVMGKVKLPHMFDVVEEAMARVRLPSSWWTHSFKLLKCFSSY